MVQVRMTDGALTVWRPNIDQSVAKLPLGAGRSRHQQDLEADRHWNMDYGAVTLGSKLMPQRLNGLAASRNVPTNLCTVNAAAFFPWCS